MSVTEAVRKTMNATLALLPPKFGKAVLMGLFGAVGCLLAAIVGEIWLWASRPSVPAAVAPTVSMVLDCSGSMARAMPDMIDAADRFATETSRTCPVGVIEFSSFAAEKLPPTQDASVLRGVLGQLRAAGGTATDAGLDAAFAQLAARPEPRVVVLFTDGAANNQRRAVAAAERLRSDLHATILVVGTEDTRRDALEELAGPTGSVFKVDSKSIGVAFAGVQQQVSKLMIGGAGSEGGGSTLTSVVRVVLWTAILAMGLGVALVVAQNLYTDAVVLAASQAIRTLIGGLVAGGVAGFVTQGVYAMIGIQSGVLSGLLGLVGWTFLGILIALGLSRVVPNLAWLRASVGGALGGWLGGFAFLIAGFAMPFFIGAALGGMAARVTGAVILGLCIGLMIAIVDAMLSEAVLEVAWGPKDKKFITLGEKPVGVGSNREVCQVYLKGQPPVVCRYRIERGQVVLENAATGGTKPIADGDQRTIGNVTLRLIERRSQASATVATPAAAPPAAPPQIAPPPVVRAVPPAAAAVAGGASCQLDLPDGGLVTLIEGRPLIGALIRGSPATFVGRPVADLARNPADPSIVGLRNLTDAAWTVTKSDGAAAQIPPGRSVRLISGTRIALWPGVTVTLK